MTTGPGAIASQSASGTKAAARLLGDFGIGPSALLGSGAQSLVYALDENRVLRVLRRPADPVQLRRLAAFQGEIEGRLPYATPLIAAIDPFGRYTIERRLPGVPALALLASLSGERRRTALAGYARGAEAIATITFPDRPFGQILDDRPLTAESWTAYLRLGLDRFIALNGSAIAATVGEVEDLRSKALALLAAVPPPAKALVHGDYFPGNVLLDDDLAVSGLVDFSVWTVVGDPILDIAGAALFLEMAEEATADDVAYVRRLVLDRHGTAIVPAGRFYRAYAAFAMAEPGNAGGHYPKMFPWALANLAALGAGTIGF